jgi:poly(3-hydroxybutyrate) depolymerase
MRFNSLRLVAVAAALALAACGSDSQTSTIVSTNTRGTLVANPPLRIASLTSQDFTAQLGASASGQGLLALAGAPACGVDFHYYTYWTVDPGGNAISDTAALMVPTGSAAPCTGGRPIVLYAHGTDTDKVDNIADVTNPNNAEGVLIAAMFAAQGYIVVAPNYAGYDASSLSYHPYVNADQNSKEMIDALAAARSALGHLAANAATDGGKLFITGYSEGGYVAMATERALQAISPTAVTAAAPLSGPYALEWLGDSIFLGDPNFGSTVFAPLITTSYQKAYSNIYSTPGDVYDPMYAAGIDTLLPSATPLATIFAQNKLPQTTLFNGMPPVPNTGNAMLDAQLTAVLAPNPNLPFSLGFSTPPLPGLINNSYRLGYAIDALLHPDGAIFGVPGNPLAAAPAQTLRQALKLNDMRQWAGGPTSPTLLCGGDQDPTVFFNDTLIISSFWGLPPPLVNVLDVSQPAQVTDSPGTVALKAAFAATEAQIFAAGGQVAVIESYHSTVAPFCVAAARGFFGLF